MTDSSIISPLQLSSILSQLPSQTPLHAPLLSASITNSTPTLPAAQPPVSQFASASLNEKQNGFYAPSQSPVPPPPAYASNPAGPPPLATATTLYVYQPTDAGDLALMPHDHIAVSEWMNADWAKGRNERTGQEGIFPRSYVTILDKQPPNSGSTNYGNMPLDVSQSGASTAEPGQPSKFNEQGKKFGKKMGNAGM